MANKRYKLVIKTNEYTGNFHKELNAYVFGYQPEYEPHEWIKGLEKNFREAAKGIFSNDPDENEEEFCEFYHYFYDEYGQNISELSNFAGNGIGTLGITVHFEKDPMPLIPFFMERLKTFPQVEKDREFGSKNLKIKSVELLEVYSSEKLLKKVL